MNREDDFGLRLAELLEEGPFEAPDHVVSAAIEHARTHPQRRLLRFAFWRSAMDSMHVAPVTPRHSNNVGRAFAVGLAAVVVVAAVVFGATLLSRGSTSPAPGGIPAAAPTPTPTPTPVSVTGASSCNVQTNGADTMVGDTEQIRGLVLACSTETSDARVAGNMAVHVSLDINPDRSAQIWGTATVQGPEGTWTGPWTGFIEKGYTIHRMAVVLQGAGAYEGLQYRFTQTGNANGSASDYQSSGVIEALPSFEATAPVAAKIEVSGLEKCVAGTLGSSGSVTTVNGVTQTRNAGSSCTEAMDDPRVNGDSTRTYNSDDRGADGATLWGTSELENSGGSWTGVWTGTRDASGATTITWSSIGSGGYVGLQYRATVSMASDSSPLDVTGTIGPAE